MSLIFNLIFLPYISAILILQLYHSIPWFSSYNFAIGTFEIGSVLSELGPEMRTHVQSRLWPRNAFLCERISRSLTMSNVSQWENKQLFF